MKKLSPVVMAELSKVSVRVKDESPVVPMRVMTDECSMVPSDGEQPARTGQDEEVCFVTHFDGGEECADVCLGGDPKCVRVEGGVSILGDG